MPADLACRIGTFCPDSGALFHPFRAISRPRLLDEDCALFVMAGLPDANGRAVCLNLIDILSLDPDILRLLNGLLNNHRLLLNNNRLLNDRRRRHDRRRRLDDHGFRAVGTNQCRTDHSADHSTDESRPEMTAMIVMVIAVMPAVMHWRRTMESAVMPERTRQTRSRAQGHRANNRKFIHFHVIFLSGLLVLTRE